jgi:hypothetical protein
MWIVPSEFSRALEGLSRLGGVDGEARSWLDVEPSANGSARTGEGIDTSDWFKSQLPPASEQPEAKIELSTLGGPSVPTPPSLTEAAEEVRPIRPPALPPQA